LRWWGGEEGEFVDFLFDVFDFVSIRGCSYLCFLWYLQ
jgi:hypothetical protein